jgi:hypothetical protein
MSHSPAYLSASPPPDGDGNRLLRAARGEVVDRPQFG